MLRKIMNLKTKRREWALVSKSGRVLEYYGTDKPSAERVAESERRVKYYKHMKGK